MQTSSVNLADVSHFLVGSDTLKIAPFFIKSFTIPSIAFSHIALSNRSGVPLHVGADSISFNELSLDVVLDSGFQTYFELLDLAMQEVDWYNNTFATPEFDLWVQVLNAEKELLFRVDFKNCKISSIGEISLDPNAELGSTVNIQIVYDYWNYTRSKCEKVEQNSNQENLTEVIDKTKCQTGPVRWFEKPLKTAKVVSHYK